MIPKKALSNQRDSKQINIIKELILKNKDIDFYVTLGNNTFDIDKEENVHLYDFVNEKELFPKMDVIISQGGMGTINKAIRAGVPIIDVPVFFGNYAQGKEIQKYGNGIFLRTINKQNKYLNNSLRRIINKKSYKEKSKKLQEKFNNRWLSCEIEKELERVSSVNKTQG